MGWNLPKHLRGTFATFYGFIGTKEELADPGYKPVKERLRFYIDTASKEQDAVLIAEDFGTVVDPDRYATFSMITRTRRAMVGARKNTTKGGMRRSAKLGFEGSGTALAYTFATADGGRAYVFEPMTIREVITAFVRQGLKDYTYQFGTQVLTSAQQYDDAESILSMLDQHGC